MLETERELQRTAGQCGPCSSSAGRGGPFYFRFLPRWVCQSSRGPHLRVPRGIGSASPQPDRLRPQLKNALDIGANEAISRVWYSARFGVGVVMIEANEEHESAGRTCSLRREIAVLGRDERTVAWWKAAKGVGSRQGRTGDSLYREATGAYRDGVAREESQGRDARRAARAHGTRRDRVRADEARCARGGPTCCGWAAHPQPNAGGGTRRPHRGLQSTVRTASTRHAGAPRTLRGCGASKIDS